MTNTHNIRPDELRAAADLLCRKAEAIENRESPGYTETEFLETVAELSANLLQELQVRLGDTSRQQIILEYIIPWAEEAEKRWALERGGPEEPSITYYEFIDDFGDKMLQELGAPELGKPSPVIAEGMRPRRNCERFNNKYAAKETYLREKVVLGYKGTYEDWLMEETDQ